MRAVFFGAGASAPAGYPLGADLLPAIEKMVQADRGYINLQTAWKAWEEYRERVPAPIKPFLTHPNPEIIFSFLDLHMEAFLRGREDTLLARARLLACLYEFFELKHSEDGWSENRSRRDYLRTVLGQLKAGDVVITLNWDTTAERTLAELRLWNPTTGYGFRKPLAVRLVGSRDGSDFDAKREATLLPSPILVLKLHGSFGWYLQRPTGLYFDNASFLEPFAFERNGERIEFIDPVDRDLGPPKGAVLLYPSFLKQLGQPEMLQVWDEAHRALHEATCVRVIGYSLPASDGAVRALLNPLRSRIDRGEVCCRISDPREEAQRRWRALLGPRATIDAERLG